MTGSESVFLEPEFLLLIAMIVGTIGFAVAARRRRVPHALVAVAAMDLFCGAVIAPLGTAHLVAVVGRALAGKGSGPGGTFVYDFRFYSLVLLGVMLVAAAVACLTAVRSLMRGDAAGRRVALSATVVLLALNVPLMPIQGFAVGFSAFALANLAALWYARKHFRVPLASEVAGHLPVTATTVGVGMLIWSLTASAQAPNWELANPVVPLPAPPLGIDSKLTDLKDPPTPERVRLGRWLFFDKRLSADGTLSCASCHVPEHAFSEPSAVSTGIRGQKGGRKAPSFINQGWTLYPHFFWDGRAGSLEEQALGPVANPIEMGNTHEYMLETIRRAGYGKYFKEAFGTEQITKDRVAKAIADYERTRMSGNSPWDRWRKKRDESAVSADVKKGHDLFFDKAACNQCHLGQNFTDSAFHNLGVGWNPKARKFADEGRHLVTKEEKDRGAFKTPTLREVGLHPPFMHDGSVKTLREVIELYNRGGIANPYLDPKIRPLNLRADEIDALVQFLEALRGEGYQDSAPQAFPNVDLRTTSRIP